MTKRDSGDKVHLEIVNCYLVMGASGPVVSVDIVSKSC